MRVSLPEQIWIDYEPATFGSRLLAVVYDLFIRIFIGMFFIILIYLVGSGNGILIDFSEYKSIWDVDTFLLCLFILGSFLLEWGYPVYFDVYHNGVSPGKRAMGLRVVDEQGLQVTFRASFLRTIFRFIDFLPFLGVVAFISMMFTKKSQRLGDIVAKTIVVHDLGDDFKALQDSGLNNADDKSTIYVHGQLYSAMQKYFQRQAQFTNKAKIHAISKLSNAIYASCPSSSIVNPLEFKSKDEWLKDMFSKMRPIKESEALSSNDRHVKWQEISKELRDIFFVFSALESVKGGAKHITKDFLSRVAVAYQVACQRYAYLSTFYPHTIEATFAARLVRLGRRIIYANYIGASNKEHQSFLKRIPESFEKIKWYCLVALSFMLMGVIGATLLVYLNPNLGHNFIDEQMRAHILQGELWTDQIQGQSAISASGIMTNNVGVTFVSFALGITGGIGTAIVLISNGAMLGGAFVALVKYGMAFRLFEFIIAHGVLELSVIVVAGGTGLYLGDAILRPGSLTRSRSIQKCGRVVVDIIVLNIICLIIAGAVEGFVSPYPDYSFWLKAFIGVGLGVIYWVYLFSNKSCAKWLCRTKIYKNHALISEIINADKIVLPCLHF